MGRVRGREKGRGEVGELFLEGLGLVRPGGGPEEEAMPGAEAQQAGRECRCVYEEGRSQEDVEKRGEHTEREGDDGSKKQRSDGHRNIAQR